MGATAAAPLNVAPAGALVVGDPPCVRGAEVVCSMVTMEVTGCCGVETMTGAVVEIITVDGTGADATGVVDTTTVDTTTVDGAGAGGTDVDGIEVDGAGVDGTDVDGTDVDGTGVDRAGLDAAGVEDTVVEGVSVDGGAETIVVPAANVVIPLHVSPLGQHSPPVTHCSPASQ